MFSGLLGLPWWGCVLATLGMTHVTIVSITIYLHRHQAHRALDLHPAVASMRPVSRCWPTSRVSCALDRPVTFAK